MQKPITSPSDFLLRIFSGLRGAVLDFLLCLLRIYRRRISPLFPSSCRFYPSCSRYMTEALLRYGILKGLWKGTRRLLSCHPFHPGGYDPVGKEDLLRDLEPVSVPESGLSENDRPKPKQKPKLKNNKVKTDLRKRKKSSGNLRASLAGHDSGKLFPQERLKQE